MLLSTIETIIESTGTNMDNFEVLKVKLDEVRQGPKPMLIYIVWAIDLDEKEYIKTQLFVDPTDMTAEFGGSPLDICSSFDNFLKKPK